MKDAATCNVDKPMPTLDELLSSVDAALAIPQPIGTLCGAIVYLHLDTRELSFDGKRCALDHPYIVGTKIYDAARQALGDIL